MNCADRERVSDPTCIALIPVVSTWRWVVLALSVMTAGSALASRRNGAAEHPFV